MYFENIFVFKWNINFLVFAFIFSNFTRQICKKKVLIRLFKGRITPLLELKHETKMIKIPGFSPSLFWIKSNFREPENRIIIIEYKLPRRIMKYCKYLSQPLSIHVTQIINPFLLTQESQPIRMKLRDFS